MTEDRTAQVGAGLLYLVGMAAGVLSVSPGADGGDFMTAVSAGKTQVMAAAFFQTVMTAAHVGFAVVLHPLLRRHGERLAIGFFGSRIVGGVFSLLGVLLLPLLVSVSSEFVHGADAGAAHLVSLGRLLRTGRDLANHVGMILASGIGSILLGALLFRAGLVPRWLSVWGMIGAALALVGSLSVMSGLFAVVTTPYIVINLPLVFQELVFAIWLIARGFTAPGELRPRSSSTGGAAVPG